MTINPKFDLARALAQAEAGDTALWEDIARHLMAKAPKPKKPRASKSGPQTWAHVILADGREFLTSAYARKTEADTLAAHSAYAQYRARMEDSGDDGSARVFLDHSTLITAVRAATILADDEVEAIRDHCYMQRGTRHGWLGKQLQELFDGLTKHCAAVVATWESIPADDSDADDADDYAITF